MAEPAAAAHLVYLEAAAGDALLRPRCHAGASLISLDAGRPLSRILTALVPPVVPMRLAFPALSWPCEADVRAA
eukprot:scaffold1319_cov64-Phaeocystis_antarctica.AAC.7